MLGFTFENLDLKNLSQADFMRLRHAIPQHGVVCIKNQSLSVDDLVALTRRIGEPVHLPEALRFNNTYNQYPELARVSNILPDGTLLKSHKAAEYWHSDGDFWQPVRNFLFNLLYSEIVPETGGETGFADLRMAYQGLKESVRKQIQDLKVVVSCDGIPDFRDVPPEDREPDAYHAIRHEHIETGTIGLYFGHTFAEIDGLAREKSDLLIAELVKAIERPENQYMHKWDSGDLLIWDNTSVMHRSMGGYGDSPRLLYRTQAFVEALTDK